MGNALEELLAGCGGVATVGHVTGTVRRIPGVVAVLPWQRRLEGVEEVIEGPGDDDVVVDAHDEGDGHRCDTHS